MDNSALKSIPEYKSTPEYLKVKEICDGMNKFSGDRGDLEIYDCPICHNSRTIYYPNWDKYGEANGECLMAYKECKCVEIIKHKKNIIKSGFAPMLEKYRFDNFNRENQLQEYIYNLASEYAKNPTGRWFFICGQSGAGKTHICTAICGELMNRGYNPYYFQWREQGTALKQLVTEGKEYQNIIKPYKEADVLYIDDLWKTGRGAVTTGDINLAFELIDYRDKQGLETIISTELNTKEIMAIDEAIEGRIREHSFREGITIAKNRQRNYRLKMASCLA